MFFMLKVSSELLFVFLGSSSKINPGNRALLSREAAGKLLGRSVMRGLEQGGSLLER